MTRACEWCGYGLQPGQPIHADCARTRIAELEAQIAELHTSGLQLTFDHEWYVSGVRRDPGNYVLRRVGPVKDAEIPF